MERVIKINNFEVKADVPDEACKACPFLYGEMGQALKFLKLEPTELTASATCHVKRRNVRHINIVVKTGQTVINADHSIRNWMSREVHCNK